MPAATPARPKDALEPPDADPGSMERPEGTPPDEPPPHEPDPRETHWIEILLVDEADQPVAVEPYEIELPNGRLARGTTNKEGPRPHRGHSRGQLSNHVSAPRPGRLGGALTAPPGAWTSFQGVSGREGRPPTRGGFSHDHDQRLGRGEHSLHRQVQRLLLGNPSGITDPTRRSRPSAATPTSCAPGMRSSCRRSPSSTSTRPPTRGMRSSARVIR